MPTWLAILIGVILGIGVCAIVSGFLDDILERVKIVHCKDCAYKNTINGCNINQYMVKDKDNGFCSNATKRGR